MRLFEYKDFAINFRNPIKFINQWWHFKYKIRAFFIWCFYFWKHNMCDFWINYGLRIIGFEFVITIYVKGK